MNKKKQAVSLFEFLKTGRFGPFIPRRKCSPEDVMKIFGEPDVIEVCAPGRMGDDYKAGDLDCFPIVMAYGTIEFHFDSPSTMHCLFFDCPFLRGPVAGTKIKLVDTALLRYGREMTEFFSLARSRGLEVGEAIPYAAPYSLSTKTPGGVEIGFEFDDPEEHGAKPTLRWFSWKEPPA